MTANFFQEAFHDRGWGMILAQKIKINIVSYLIYYFKAQITKPEEEKQAQSFPDATFLTSKMDYFNHVW